jgi:hypothetical protein
LPAVSWLFPLCFSGRMVDATCGLGRGWYGPPRADMQMAIHGGRSEHHERQGPELRAQPPLSQAPSHLPRPNLTRRLPELETWLISFPISGRVWRACGSFCAFGQPGITGWPCPARVVSAASAPPEISCACRPSHSLKSEPSRCPALHCNVNAAAKRARRPAPHTDSFPHGMSSKESPITPPPPPRRHQH